MSEPAVPYTSHHPSAQSPIAPRPATSVELLPNPILPTSPDASGCGEPAVWDADARMERTVSTPLKRKKRRESPDDSTHVQHKMGRVAVGRQSSGYIGAGRAIAGSPTPAKARVVPVPGADLALAAAVRARDKRERERMRADRGTRGLGESGVAGAHVRPGVPTLGGRKIRRYKVPGASPNRVCRSLLDKFSRWVLWRGKGW